MSMDHAVSTLRQSCYYQLRKISQLRPLISEKATKQLVSSFVLSKIDYCNSLFYSTSIENIYKLLKVQNHAARLVKRAPKQSSVTAILVELHWLPVKARIIYKIAVVVFNLLSSEDSPNYLKELIVRYQPQRTLRSQNKSLLTVPSTNLSFGKKAFTFSGPEIWNSLPQNIKNSETITKFKSQLKTHLFNTYLL